MTDFPWYPQIDGCPWCAATEADDCSCCSKCGGSGTVYADVCDRCDGFGKELVTKGKGAK